MKKPARKDYKFITVFILGLASTVAIYALRRNFYQAVIPTIVALIINLVFFYLEGREKELKKRRSAEAYLDFLESVSTVTDLGSNFKTASYEESKKISDSGLKKLLDSYLAEGVFNSIFTPAFYGVECEQDLSSLFQYGLTHPISEEFKESFAKSLTDYRSFLAHKTFGKNKVVSLLDVVFLGLVTLVGAILLIYLFKTLL